MDRYPKDEATAKNFVWNKSSSHSQEKLEKPVGGGGWMPPPGFNKPMTDQALSNSLVSAAENCKFMIHTLSGTTSISGSFQYPLRMNLILSNFELSNGIG